VQGHVDQLAANGLDLVSVSNSPRERPLCEPWEGKVLSIGGTVAGSIERPSVTSDDMVKVVVAGTLDQARAAGFQHPNCRHSVSAYLPGATRLPEVTAEPDGYVDQQRQRAIERSIRQRKTRSAIALDGSARATAEGKVKEWQVEMRRHMEAHPDLKRQSAREQVGKAR
jgi:hypothetical protein